MVHRNAESQSSHFRQIQRRFEFHLDLQLILQVDMQTWMLVHLDNGTFQGDTMLAPWTMHLMHERHFSMAGNLPGYTYGLYEYRRNNVTALLTEVST